MTPRNTEYPKYNPPGAQVSDDVLAQKYLLYTPPAWLKRKIKVPTGVFLHVDSADGVVSLGISLFHFITSSAMLYDCIGLL
jgi:hypothetical protein